MRQIAQNAKRPAEASLSKFKLVPEAGFEPARLSTTVFETAASAVPPLGHRTALYRITAHPSPKINSSFCAIGGVRHFFYRMLICGLNKDQLPSIIQAKTIKPSSSQASKFRAWQ